MSDQSAGGLSVASIKRIERGAPVYFDTARRYAELTGRPLDQLLAVTTVRERIVSERALAVMPFEVLDSEEATQRFADELAEAICNELVQRPFPVLSRSTAFSYRGIESDPRIIGRALGADYLIEGSVRSGDLQSPRRASLRLVETTTGRTLWSRVIDFAHDPRESLNASMVYGVAGQIFEVVVDDAGRPTLLSDIERLGGWELLLRGLWQFQRMTHASVLEARRLFQRSLELEPQREGTWASLAALYPYTVINQWAPDFRTETADFRALCEAYERHHPGSVNLKVARGYADLYQGLPGASARHVAEAIADDPFHLAARGLTYQLEALTGDRDAGHEGNLLLQRLIPRGPDRWALAANVAVSAFVSSRFDEMQYWAEQAIAAKHGLPFAHVLLAAARSKLGDQAGQRRAEAEVVALTPFSSSRQFGELFSPIGSEAVEQVLGILSRLDLPR